MQKAERATGDFSAGSGLQGRQSIENSRVVLLYADGGEVLFF